MAVVFNQEQFIRALEVFFGDGPDSGPGYDPVKGLDGTERVASAFGHQGARLNKEIDEMFEAAHALPGIWTKPSLPLNDALDAIAAFIAAEYAFLPALLQERVVNCCGYELSK